MTDYNDKPPDVNDGRAEAPAALSQEAVDWERRGREAYTSSTTYVDTNYRKGWDDSIRAFHNQHASDSKYVTDAFAKRSRIYRPKTRSTIRKNEAAAAAAYFSNIDTVMVTAENEGDPKARIGAEIHKALLEYRLTSDPTKTGIPWFQVVVGGIQDAQTQGAVVAGVEWRFRQDEQGKVLEDRPWVELKPIENIRIDPGAHWYDPINTSPYVIELIPMYVCDVHTRMRSGEWLTFDDGVIRAAMQTTPDQTRQARNPGQVDVHENNTPIGDYEKVWVQRHIHRSYGQDWHFYMLGTERLLTQPVPLEQVVFHGMRPYVLGVAILETHRAFPDSVPQLIDGLQREANEIANQRLDNVKFVLNKRYFVKRGRNVDIPSLIRNVPGGVTLMDDVEGDIKESQWPDVTASSFAEQDRINADVDDLIGNFSAGSVQTNRKMNETVGGMGLISQAAQGMTTYMITTFNETFVERILSHLVKLEAKYETDERVLALVGEKAQIRQKYGVDRVQDWMLDQDMTVKANAAMGASDPSAKLQRFGFAAKMLSEIALTAQQTGMNMTEVSKEIFAHAGYRDGTRFLTSADPQKAQMQQQIQQLMGMVQQAQQMLESKAGEAQQKMQAAQMQAQAGMKEKAMELQADQQSNAQQLQADLMEVAIKERGAMAREKLKQQAENRRALVSASVAMNKPKPEKRAES